MALKDIKIFSSYVLKLLKKIKNYLA